LLPPCSTRRIMNIEMMKTGNTKQKIVKSVTIFGSIWCATNMLVNCKILFRKLTFVLPMQPSMCMNRYYTSVLNLGSYNQIQQMETHTRWWGNTWGLAPWHRYSSCRWFSDTYTVLHKTYTCRWNSGNIVETSVPLDTIPKSRKILHITCNIMLHKGLPFQGICPFIFLILILKGV